MLCTVNKSGKCACHEQNMNHIKQLILTSPHLIKQNVQYKIYNVQTQSEDIQNEAFNISEAS